MIFKKILIGISLFSFLGGCAQNAALLGPAYTLVTSGNVYHAGFTYGGNEIITKTTGKSAVQNFKEALVIKKKDTEFQKLVKKNIRETRKKLNITNQ
tara:strand:- start:1145 stop:1435 length:291 start_codon:yes stop_codon:yes gene_type:complete